MRTIFAFLGVVAFLGCADKEPASVKVEVQSMLHDEGPAEVRTAVLNQAGETLEEVEAALEVDGARILELVGGTKVRCLKCGTGTVTGRLGEASGQATVACRPVRLCPDRSSATLTLGALGTVVAGAEDKPLAIVLKGLDGAEVTGATIKVSSSDEAVAMVSRDDKVKCIATGDAEITATVGGLEAKQSVACRLVGKLRTRNAVTAIIPNDPVALPVEALSEAGKPLEDVAISVESSDSQIATWGDSKVTPHAVGKAKLTFRAGAATKVVEVTVKKKVETKPLLLADGGVLNVTLSQGNYEVEIEAPAGGGHGVTVSWVGGDGCQPHAEAANITARCNVPNSGALIVTNPTFMGLGDAARGYLSIYQVP